MSAADEAVASALAAAVVLGPDDLLVVALHRSATRADFDAFREAIAERVEGERIIIVAGIEAMAVLRDAS